jgi:hypothetical protein
MSIKYYCRYCQSKIGELQQDNITEFQLGFHFLTPTERKEIVSYQDDGCVEVRVICDYCKEALDANPELMLLTNHLQ